MHGAPRGSLPVQSGLVSNLEGSCDETPAGLARQGRFLAPGLFASILQTARDYRRGKKALWLHALGPQNCQGSLARRVISHELRPQFVALRRPRNLCLPPPSQRVRFGSRRAARAADEPAAEPAADEPAAAARIAANQGKYDGRQKASRQVRDRPDVR